MDNFINKQTKMLLRRCANEEKPRNENNIKSVELKDNENSTIFTS